MAKPPHDIPQQTVVGLELESHGDASNAKATSNIIGFSEKSLKYLSSQYPIMTPSMQSGNKSDHKTHDQEKEKCSFNNENVDEADSAPEYLEGGYGWIVLIGAVMVSFWSPGLHFAWGIYQSHLVRDNIIPGANASSLSWVGSIAAWGLLVVGPVIVPITAKIGERATLSIGTFLLAAGYIGASFATQYWHLYLTLGFLFGFGGCFAYFTALGVLNQYFNKRRGLANGIVTAGGSIGTSVMAMALRVMLPQIGFRWTLRILGIVMFAVIALATVLIRPYHPVRPSRIGVDGRNQDVVIRAANVDVKSYRLDIQIFKHLRFTIFIIGTILYGMTVLSIIQIIPGYAISLGISSEDAAHMVTASSITSIFFRLVMGHLADHIGVFNISIILGLLCAIINFGIWPYAKSVGMLYLFAVLNGALLTPSLTLVPVAATRVLNPTFSRSALGFTFFALSIGALAGLPITQHIVSEHDGNYLMAIYFLSTVSLLCPIAFIIHRQHIQRSLILTRPSSSSPPPRRHQQLSYGAINAMQDAVVLANVIYDLESNSIEAIKSALQEYRDQRFPFASYQYTNSKIIAKLMTGQKWSEKLMRQIAFNFLPEWIRMRGLNKAVEYRPQAAFLPLVENRGTGDVLPQHPSKKKQAVAIAV
ncbi:hypothetical protein BGX27_000923 [Mortierella sp. AM989]|nr:hypothetical protein BGX27_000923 [Mortierella sp. AM989]